MSKRKRRKAAPSRKPIIGKPRALDDRPADEPGADRWLSERVADDEQRSLSADDLAPQPRRGI